MIMPETPDPLIGATVAQFFRITRRLAVGGMGTVYLAEHIHDSHLRKVVKTILPEYTRIPEIQRRFQREAATAARLHHRNILAVDNFGTLENGQLFLMAPFLDGEPLDEFVAARGGRLSEHRALHFLIQLAKALDHAHASGVVHRDLKPSNVFVVRTDEGYEIRLLDFGIAKRSGDEEIKTSTGTTLGTPYYMPVEQYRDAGEVTHLADVFSFAVLAWELVTGELPWGKQDPRVMYFQQMTMIPARPPPEVMSPEWVDIMLPGLRAEPSRRPPSIRAFIIALASALPARDGMPSGAEMLADLAPQWAKTALPMDLTLKNRSNVNRMSMLLWSVETPVPHGLPPLGVVTVGPQPVAAPPAADEPPVMRVMTPVMMPTVNGWPAGAVAKAPPVVATPIVRTKARRIALAVAVAGTAALVSMIVVSRLIPPTASAEHVADAAVQASASDASMTAYDAAPVAVVVPIDAAPAPANDTKTANPPPIDAKRKMRTPSTEKATTGATGTVVVDMTPSWAYVSSNGKSCQSPCRLKLPAGKQRVRVRNPDLQRDETVTVTVRANETTTVRSPW
jgi:serine/threonine-protein kinase